MTRPIDTLAFAGSETLTSLDPSLRIVAVGEVVTKNIVANQFDRHSKIAMADFQNLTPDFVSIVKPDVVLSPLLSKTFDCLDMAQRLSDIGFQGRYRVMTQPLPRPEVVLRELRALAPKMDIDLITTAPTAELIN